jgi:hypothetical protein
MEENETGKPDTKTSQEIDALTVTVQALRPLAPEVRQRIIDAAFALLGTGPRSGVPVGERVDRPGKDESKANTQVKVIDIRTLRELKQPRSANEMAALVAYYLQEEAPLIERKNLVNSADIKQYFKQAHFRLPGRANMALVNAKNAGYLDMMGTSEYRLNAVGYNLVAHSLPRKGGEAIVPARGRAKRSLGGRVRGRSPRG